MTAALITGASTGLGRELAGLFARDGVDVVAVSSERSTAQLDELAEELRARYGVRVETVTMDLAAPGAGADLVSASTNSASTSRTWSITPEWGSWV